MSGEKQINWMSLTSSLLEWYHSNGRETLPWRQTGLTPYHIWVSEVMLQQTQVNRVISYYENFIRRFPTVQHLAASTWEEFLPFYQGLGYYARGRNMLKAAQEIVEKHNGIFPTTIQELRSLPGVGPYTAAAILSFGSGYPHLAYDTNHQRVWGRVLHGNKKEIVTAPEIETALPKNTPYKDLNAAVMDLAAMVCLNRAPLCNACPLKHSCVYFAESGASEPVAVKEKSTFPTKEAQTILFLHENHKTYFSASKKSFEPFFLPQPILTRAQIKSYFARTHNLNLSVRPPQWRGLWKGKPVQIVFAQILDGQHGFDQYSEEIWQAQNKEDLQEWS